MIPKIAVVNREKYSRIEIKQDTGEWYNIEVTENGLQITSLFDQTDMVVKPRTGNQILISNVLKLYLW